MIDLTTTPNGSLAQKTFRAQSGASHEHLYARQSGLRQYELKDHLGNVRVVVSDLKSATNQSGSLVNNAKISAFYNYYPFGMQLPNRYAPSSKVGEGGYRYGFNGKEKDDDVGSTTSAVYDYRFRIYDSRIGRFLSVDPLFQSYPWYTPFQFAGNKPIKFIDLDGRETAPNKGDSPPVYYKPSIGVGERIKEALNHFFGFDVKPPEAPGEDYNKYIKDLERYTKEKEEASIRIAKADKFLRNLAKELGHTALDAAGTVPVAGEFFDAANGVWYFAEGDYLNGSLSVSACIPFLGWASTAGKYGTKTISKLSGSGVDLLVQISKKTENLSNALDVTHVKAAGNDILGKPVIINGKSYDHLTEVRNNLTGLKNQIMLLEEGINKGKFTGEALDKAKEMRSSLQNTYDEINSYLNNIETKAAKK